MYIAADRRYAPLIDRYLVGIYATAKQQPCPVVNRH